MSSQPNSENTAAESTNNVLDNLTPGSPLQPQISATLNAALKTQLAASATATNLPALVGLINTMPAADLATSKDLTLQAFLQQQLNPMVSADPVMKAAIDEEIAKLPSAATVSATLDLTSPLATHPLLQTIVADAQLQSLLSASPAITADLQDRFVSAYDANTEPISDFWMHLAADPQLGPVVPQLQLTLQLGTLTSNNADLAAKLIAQFHPATVRDLSKVTSAQLAQLMTAENVQLPASISATTTPASISQYADSIVATLKQAFPTDYVAQSFSASTDTANQAVAAFLNKSQDFDFSTTHIDTYFTSNPPALAGLTSDQVNTLTGRLKAAQRVFRINSDGATMQILIGQDLDSAYAIASSASDSFVAQYSNALGGEDLAQQIHANAISINSTTNLIVRQAQESASQVMANVIPGGQANQALQQNLPNWQQLFGTTSSCKCCECRAIDGPAAYFVSLLQFLRNLGKNSQHNTPLDVLIGSASSGHGNVTNPRRPDLAHLKLNCANADTELPYVDIVNEILENYIANGHVSYVNMNNTPYGATAAVLNVTPEYTQTPNAVAAYNALNSGSIVYPHTLPFDRYLETVRIYLDSLGVSLYQLMQVFGTPAPALQTATQLAAEYLTISLPEFELITDQDFSGNTAPISTVLAGYFGYSATTIWLLSICQVPNLLSRTALPLAELVKLLGTSYLNPNHLDPQDAVSLNIPSDSCDTTSMVLQLPTETAKRSRIVTKPFLSPLPPFLRLKRKLGWTIAELDYALRAFGYAGSPASTTEIAKSDQILSHLPGGGTPPGGIIHNTIPQTVFIPSDFVLIAAQIQQLTQTLGLSVSDVVSLWADIDTDGRSSPYVALFQNKAVVNPPDSGLRLLYQVPLSAVPTQAIPVLIPDGASLTNTGSELTCVSYDATTQQLSFIGSMTESQRDTLLTWANTASGSIQEDTVMAVQLLYSQRWYRGIQIAPTVEVLVGPFLPPHFIGSFKLMTDLVDNHVNPIIAALKIGTSDLAAIRADIGSTSGDRLSITNLSAFHRYAILAQSLGLSIPDLITLKNLAGLQPFALDSGANGPKTDPMVQFVAAAQQVAASQFTVSQLAYLYGQVEAQTGSLAPLQSTQDAVMATILVGLQNIAAANAYVPDPQGTALRKKLAVLLASTPLQLDPTMALIAGASVYTSQIQQTYPPSVPLLPVSPAAGAQVVYVTTANIDGSITTNDSLTLQVTSSAIPGSPVAVSYQVQATDTFESIAAALAAQVNLNTGLIAAGISATVSGAVLTLAAPPPMNPIPVWAFNPPPAAAVSETVTFAGNLVSTGPMTDATWSAISTLAGATSQFISAAQDLYNQTQDILTDNLSFLAAPGPYSVSLAALPQNVTLPLGPVSFIPSLTVGTVSANQSLTLTITPSGGLSVQIEYTIAATDNSSTAAATLTTGINANASLIAAGISATVLGANITLIVEPSSTPSQTWEANVIPGPTSISVVSTLTVGTSIVVAPSDQVSSYATATIGGPLNQGDTLSLTMTPVGGSALPAVTFVVGANDTPSTAATALAAKISAALSSAGISATASGAVITIAGPNTPSPLPVVTVNPPAALILSGNLVSAGPMLNSTRTSLLASAPFPLPSTWPTFVAAVEALYQQAWGSATASGTPVATLIDTIQTPADAYDYVLQGLLTYLTNTQSRNLVKQTLAQALALDPGVVDLLLEGNPALGVASGLLPSSFSPAQSAMTDFLGGLNGATTQFLGKLLVPTTGPYNFSVVVTVNNVPDTSAAAQSALTIGGQPITLYVDGGPIIPINLTAGQMYNVFLTVPKAPAGSAVSLQWRIAPAPLSTLAPIPNLSLMPCDGNWGYPNLALLYRLAILINGFTMSASDVAQLLTHGNDFSGIDPQTGNIISISLAGLSLAGVSLTGLLPGAFALDAPALFNQWQRLNALYFLKASLPAGNTTVFDVFAVASAPGASLAIVSPDVVQEIVSATGWNKTDVATLTASSASFNFVDANFRNEKKLVKMAACIAIGSTTGISAQQLLSWANPPSTTPPGSPFYAIAQDVQHTVKAKYVESTWLQVGKPLNDKLRATTKDALIQYILYLMPNAAYSTVDDLYGFFLIDVEMCTCMETSRLVQASAAVQLFVQRCLLNLESQNPDATLQIAPSAFSQQNITEWNQWRKNYRVWQAAVEVLIYPENWIIPELRSNQTPFFQDLVTTLLQGNVTEANAEAAFLGYLESLQQVARLEIMGVYTDNDTNANTQITHVIARTFTTPNVYFYRTLNNTTYAWSPWEKITADISGDTIIPVIWNGRLFLFWPVYTEVTDPANTSQNSPAAPPINTNSGSTTVASPAQSQKTLQIQLAWSEYKSGQWTSKQITADSLVPNHYQSYSSTFDPTTVLYTASQGGSDSDSLVVTAYATSFPVTVTSNVAWFAFLNFPGDSKTANNGQSVRQNVSQMLTNLYTAVANPGNFAGGTYNSFLSQAQAIEQDSMFPPPFRAIATQLVTAYSQIGAVTPSPAALCSLTTLLNETWEIATIWITNLGTFVFDGPQGSVETNPNQSATTQQTSAFTAASSLYVFDANQVQSAFVNQSVKQYDSYLSVVISGNPVSLFSAPSTPLPSTLMFPQHLLPSYSLQEASGSFENVLFYADRRRTYFITSEVSSLKATVVRNKSQAAPPSYVSVGQIYFFNHYHPWVGEFIKRVNWPTLGISAMLNPHIVSPATQTLDSADDNNFDFSNYYGVRSIVDPDYTAEIIDFSGYAATLAQQISQDIKNQSNSLPGGSAAYSLYNWELFFYIPLMIAIQLSENQQFDDAESWFRYIFDPTIDPNKTEPTGYSSGSPNCYWNFLPFNHLPQDQGLNALLTATTGPLANALQAQIAAWDQAPFDPDVIAEFRFVAYQKTTVMKYLDHLLRRGDYCFGQNTRESIYEAIEYYILADQILGKKPTEITMPGVILDQTYWDLLNDPGGINALGNANVQLENAFPFVVSGTVQSKKNPNGNTILPSTPYFCIPDNPTLLGYYDTVSDRLYKIRHCMNIQGQVEQLALFAPPINPALLVAAEAAGVDLSSVLNDINAAVPHYRFATMMAKALELCSEVRGLGNALLSNLEKSDAEGLALLRAGQELAVQQAVLQIKQLQVQEANAGLAGLQATLAVTTARQTYYQGLIQGGLSSYETAQVTAMALSEEFKIVAQASGTEASAGYAIPQIDVGINGVFGTPSTHVTFGGVQVAGAASEISKAFGMLADMSSLVASMAGLSGSWDRRAAEWAFQLQTATLEIAQIQQQITAANFRVQITTQDANNQNLLIANAAAVQSTLRSKFTNQALYQWMVGQVSAVFFQCYQMVYDLAKRAEACYRFELGIQQSSYIQFGYWDSLKNGLLSGEKLFQDLKRLEVAYLDQNQREYEISKSISLLLLDPSAFVALKLNGACLITLPEAYFDMDYPGHYMRRIRNVSLTIPCVTGPYTSVNCTLTLLQSKIRVTNSLPSANSYVEKPTGSDVRFAYNFSATESIATSTAQNDSGLFEVNFRDERYLPFEGSGVISQWQLNLPKDCNAFDFETITDLVINLRYTARNGGASLQSTARKSAVLPPAAIQPAYQNPVSLPAQNNLQRYFSLRHEFPTEWYKLMNPPPPASGTTVTSTMQIELGNERFPFQYRSSKISINLAQFYIVSGSQTEPVPSIVGATTLASAAVSVGPATLYAFAQPPAPAPLVPGGPKSWTLSFPGALSNVADIILVCTFSVVAG